MSRNSSGIYSLYTPGNPVVTGTVISSTWANNSFSDLATALTDSLSRTGLGGMLAALQLDNGTIGTPGLNWGAETTAGLYRASAGNFRYAIGGADVLTITSTGFAVTGTLAATGNLSAANFTGPFAGFANPSASIGLAAVNGAATTAMRSDAAPALSQSIAPTWTGIHTFTNTTANGGAVMIGGAGYGAISLRDTTAAANGKTWTTRVSAGGNWSLITLDDADGVGKSVMAAVRSGTAVSSLSLGNATDNPSFTFLGTGTLTGSGQGAWSAQHTFSSTSLNAGSVLFGGAGYGAFSLRDTSGAANGKLWTQRVSGVNWSFITLTDADGVGSAILAAVRSGTAVSSLSFGNATDNPTFTFLGTGAAAFGGSVTATTTVSDSKGNVRDLPLSSTATTLVLADAGKVVDITAAINIPASVFSAGNAVSIYNNSAGALNITISAGTLRLAGTATTGTRSLAARGMCTLYFRVGGATPEVIATGNVT